MNLIFNEDSKLEDINKAFQQHFPFLKIQFYEDKIDQLAHKEVPGDPIKDYSKTIHDVLHARINCSISMNGHTKVKNFEKNWIEDAGIWVQVFRKSGKIWLQTTVTDEMTLSEINHLGEEMNMPMGKDELPDIHEQE
ncbi:MAG: hypothetical protein K1X56_02940 [Flavobacteriales bacterium]|nr:hypothetical protein [Flavobacteriales bacterium]